jgi:hypothetical protein
VLTKFFEQKGAFLAEFVVSENCMLFVCKYPENETLLVVDPVPPKARILEVGYRNSCKK